MTNMMLNFDQAARHQQELIDDAARFRARSPKGLGLVKPLTRLLGGRSRRGGGVSQSRPRSEATAATA